MKTSREFLNLVLFLTLGLASSCGPGNSDSSSFLSNEFTSVGSVLTIAKISNETYYGRVLFKSGGQLYGASIHFDLNTQATDSAYFSNFYLDRLVLFVNLQTAVPIVTSSINLNVSSGYSLGSNSLRISNITNRYVGLNIDFGNNLNLTDVLNAAAIFTRDFSTFVGGDNSTFFFIAQKATSQNSVALNDLLGNWFMIDFKVSGLGILDVGVPSKLAAGGAGGNGFTVFRGANAVGATLYGGEFNITDAGTGAMGLGYDSTPDDGNTISMDGSVDGAFLLSPSKNFVLGFDARNNRYFAGSR